MNCTRARAIRSLGNTQAERERVRHCYRGIAYVVTAEPTHSAHPIPFASREEFLAAYQQTPACAVLSKRARLQRTADRFCSKRCIAQTRDLRRSSMLPAPSDASVPRGKKYNPDVLAVDTVPPPETVCTITAS